MLIRHFSKYFNDFRFLNKYVYILSLLGVAFSIMLFYISGIKSDVQSYKDVTSNDLGNFIEKQDVINVIRPFIEGKIYNVKPDIFRQAYQEYLIMQDPFRSQQEFDQKLASINTLEDYLPLIDITVIENTNKKVVASFYKIQTLNIVEGLLFVFLILSQIISAVSAFRVGSLSK